MLRRREQKSAIITIQLSIQFCLEIISCYIWSSYFYEVRQNKRRQKKTNTSTATNVVQKWQNQCSNISAITSAGSIARDEDWFVDNRIIRSDFIAFFAFKWQQFRFCFLALIFCDLEIHNIQYKMFSLLNCATNWLWNQSYSTLLN